MKRGQRRGTQTSASGDQEPNKSTAARTRAVVHAQASFEAPPADGDLLHLDPKDIAPNPLNIRLDLDDVGDLRNSIAELGVLENGIVARRSLFVEKYPDCAAKTLEREWVAIFGHRRRAAAEGLEGVQLPMVLRDDIVRNLRVEEIIAAENKERQDLSPIEEALAIAQYQRRHKVSAEAAGYTLYGYQKGTVSKRVALLKLPAEVQDATHKGELGPTDAYLLAKELRGEPESQSAAWKLMQENKSLTAESAVSRLRLARASQVSGGNSAAAAAGGEADAEADGAQKSETHADEEERSQVSGGNSAAAGGEADAEADGAQKSETHADEEERSQVSGGNSAAAGGEADAEADGAQKSETHADEEERSQVSGGNPKTGGVPQPSTEPTPERIASRLRDEACKALCKLDRPAPAEQITRRLAAVVLRDDDRTQARSLAHRWLHSSGLGPDEEDPDTYHRRVLEAGDANLSLRVAFAIALADDELRISTGNRWDERAVSHLELLVSRGGHAPTEWEQEKIAQVSAGNFTS